MAIKVSGVTVIDDDRSAKFEVMNPGVIAGSGGDGSNASPGDMVFSESEGRLIYWTGSEWK
tara:strand:- start:204 stop:386 length:183 start_codon:yes stop_codon:yes gene_type:complete